MKQTPKDIFHSMLTSPIHVGTKDIESFTDAFPYCRALWFVRAKRETASPEHFPAQKAMGMASLMAEELDTLQLYLYPEGEPETAAAFDRALDAESLPKVSDEVQDQVEQALAEPLPTNNVHEENDLASTAQAPETSSGDTESITEHTATVDPLEDKRPELVDLHEPVLEAAQKEEDIDTGETIEAVPSENASYSSETTEEKGDGDEIVPADEPEERETALEAEADSPDQELALTDAQEDTENEPNVTAKEGAEALPNTEETILANSDEGENGLHSNSQDAAAPLAPETKQQDDLSKYDDEHMPHSFLWWLHKTRIAYSATYQPYVSKEPAKAVISIKRPEETLLDQQMKEHIFHLQAPEDKLQVQEDTVQTSVFRITRGADDIIDRFIREEPQITPPKPDKITLENKARKSAEDQSAFVSETLANVYAEQGLYQRAIDTYLKLSLKYPEKSAYFADRINELKKKTN